MGAQLHAAALTTILGDESRILTDPQLVQQLSRDFYWYSPILRQLLQNKTADFVVQPLTSQEIQAVAAYAYKNNLPITTRGAGTGNYGQAVPLNRGIILDLSRMDQIEKIETTEGYAICQPGVRLGTLETEARKLNWELRCYPSTIAKASVGGFLAGGSGGIGSVFHGGLRDFQTVRAIEIVTMESEPRILYHEGEAVHDILHAWGTNGVITRIWLALTPAIEWAQSVICFKTFNQAFDFAEKIATTNSWIKRLVTVFEPPIANFFSPIKQFVLQDQAVIFFMIAASQQEFLEAAAKSAGAQVTQSGPYEGLRTRPLLSDYTWNHTTLWAMKADESYTYIQSGFHPQKVREQFAQLKSRFPGEIFFHIEFMKNGDGQVIPGAIPVVKFTSEARLNELIDYCREIGVSVANPHVNNVEGGGRYRSDNAQLLAKKRYDPKGLMNPGKMVTFEPEKKENNAVAESATGAAK
jgi:FAD/FMN-containing dehydrogenase